MQLVLENSAVNRYPDRTSVTFNDPTSNYLITVSFDNNPDWDDDTFKNKAITALYETIPHQGV